MAQTKLPPIQPDQLPSHLRPLVEEIDGEPVFQFGIYRIKHRVNNTEKVGGTWDDADPRGSFEFASQVGGVYLTASLDVDEMLDNALSMLENVKQPIYVRHTARMVSELIYSVKSLPQSYPLHVIVGLSAALGMLYERMHVEQQQHFAKEGHLASDRRKKGGNASKKPGLWDWRCEQYREIEKNGSATKFDICRQIAEQELPRDHGEDYKRWQDRVGTRQRTINDDIGSQLQKRLTGRAAKA
ncbi:MAG: hypothetical protein SGJ20_06165 [Planctomycetota bacterium]|nr:hypothetical protein [Planctomycetota bacterium]